MPSRAFRTEASAVPAGRALPRRQLVLRAIQTLASQLPPGWRLTEKPVRAWPADAVLQLRAPDAAAVTCGLVATNRVDPRDVPLIVARLRDAPASVPLLATWFLSPRTRERLDAAGVGYVDFAGNARIAVERPGLFVLRQSSDRNPWREDRPTRTLKGAKAGRIVRALCDFRPPLGVRQLAERTGTDPGYVSRTLALLEREALITRSARGSVTETDWQGLIRRWAQDYSALDPRRAGSYLEPRGVPALLQKLRKAEFRYVVTGSVAASRMAPIAPPRLVLSCVDDPGSAAQALDLRPTDAGANVILALPFDAVVYDRTCERDGLRLAAPSQVAADLLTSPGRGPAEADALLRWMAGHEDAWRA